jgi:hypothetical protein
MSWYTTSAIVIVVISGVALLAAAADLRLRWSDLDSHEAHSPAPDESP